MEVGLLWFDNDKGRDLNAKIARAIDHYQKKFGRSPNLCYVHPSLLPGNRKAAKIGSVAVKSNRTVLPHHFWLGMDD